MKKKKNTDLVLLFDGVCNLCNGLIQFTIKRDPVAKFHFASLQSVAGKRFMKQYQLPINDLNTFVFVKDGKALIKSTAGLTLLRELGGFWGLFYILMVIPRFIRDGVYDLIARSRYSIFGRRKSCMIPTANLKRRFL